MRGFLEKPLAIVAPYDRTSELTIHYKQPLPATDQKTLLAWATKIDITPPPGLPTAGHSLYASFGVGFRNKLMARVAYIKPKKGRPVALVQCDLISGSRIVHHKVAELIAEKTDVDSAGLVITATHTHSGPGNYVGNNFYNDLISNAKGFIEKYFVFICEQIATAVIEAYENRKPARVATGTTTVEKVTKNRSLPAYLLNENIQQQKANPSEFDAVNPYLHMIRIDCLDSEGEYVPVGTFTNFSNHPNSRPSELDDLYHGDVTAFSERVLEQRIKKHYSTEWEPVHAAANGAHGDCNPNHSEEITETFSDLRALGETIASRAFDLFVSLDKRLKDDAVIRYQARDIDLLKENRANSVQLAKRPAMGMASLAGAQGRGRGSFTRSVPFFAAGYPRRTFTDSEHGSKRIAFGPLQKLLYQKKDYPHYFFAQIVQIDDHVLLPLPWEVTFESGNRIEAYVKNKAEAAGMEEAYKFIITDVANGYLGYMTTPEEYSLQFYEGGSNHYGANTCDFVKMLLGNEIESFVKGDVVPEQPETYSVSLHATDFYPKELNPLGARTAQGAPTYAFDKAQKESYWGFTWLDVSPGLIDFHRSLIHVEESVDNEIWEPLVVDDVPVNDAGMDISVRFLQKVDDKNMGRYETRWHNPVARNGKYYRFVIQSRGGLEVFYSPSFTAN